LLALDKVHLHKNNEYTFSVYHFVLFIYFTVELEGTARSLLSAVAPA